MTKLLGTVFTCVPLTVIAVIATNTSASGTAVSATSTSPPSAVQAAVSGASWRPARAAGAAVVAPANAPSTPRIAAATPATTLSALQSAADEITGSRAALSAVGVHVQEVAVDATHDRLILGVSPGASTNAVQNLRRRLPAVPITVRYVRVLSAAGTGEYAAGPPWVTGMELYKLFYQGGGLYYTECTAGFNVINPSTRRTYVTSAAHCFNTGDTILHSIRSSGQQVGTVTARSGYGSSADVELITPNVANTPNTILVDNSTRLPVSSYLPVTSVGTSLCKSGITTGQTCGNVVQSTSATVCYSSGCFYNQEQTYNRNLAEVAYYGDSGGPVYLYNGNSSVTAAGSVSGFEETCNAAGTGCRLNGVMFFTPIHNMQQTLGVLP